MNCMCHDLVYLYMVIIKNGGCRKEVENFAQGRKGIGTINVLIKKNV